MLVTLYNKEPYSIHSRKTIVLLTMLEDGHAKMEAILDPVFQKAVDDGMTPGLVAVALETPGKTRLSKGWGRRLRCWCCIFLETGWAMLIRPPGLSPSLSLCHSMISDGVSDASNVSLHGRFCDCVTLPLDELKEVGGMIVQSETQHLRAWDDGQGILSRLMMKTLQSEPIRVTREVAAYVT